MRARAVMLVVAALAIAVGPACGDDDDDDAAAETKESKAGTFLVLAGAADEKAPADVGLFGFYPSRIAVQAGDVIRFENGSGAIPVPHMVTRGVGADIPARLPPPLVPGVGQVPRVWGLCVSDEAGDPSATDCADGSKAPYPPSEDTLKMPAFAGQGFYNSGIFDKGQVVEMPIAADAEADSYTFFCYLHPATMELTVDIVPAGDDTQTQDQLDAAAAKDIAKDATDGVAAEAAAASIDRPPAIIQAGAEQGRAVVTRFFPSTVIIAAGEAVTWTNEGFDPHVVALGQDVGPHDPENFAPPMPAPGGDYTGGFAISGVFGHAPFPTTTYALRFPKPGKYRFFCPIHPGMAGEISVS